MGFRIKNNAIKCSKNLIQFVDMMLKHIWKKQCETPCKMKKNLDINIIKSKAESVRESMKSNKNVQKMLKVTTICYKDIKSTG